MSVPKLSEEDRILFESLLAEAATQGLSRAQRSELDLLGARLGLEAERELEKAERAALAIDRAFGAQALDAQASEARGEGCRRPVGQTPSLPGQLDESLGELAAAFVAALPDARSPLGGSRLPKLQEDSPGDGPRLQRGDNLLPFRHRPAEAEPSSGEPLAVSLVEPGTRAAPYAWWLAAAVLMIALVGWWPRLANNVGSVADARPALATAEDPGQVGRAADTVTIALAGTEDPAARGASGIAEWSAVRQSGWLSLQGLEANDPSRYQYQLWIFDGSRDERYPVDGGVFDIPAVNGSGPVSIPIAAKVRVSEPTLFAITIERPGGVVVSERERIVLAGAFG